MVATLLLGQYQMFEGGRRKKCGFGQKTPMRCNPDASSELRSALRTYWEIFQFRKPFFVLFCY